MSITMLFVLEVDAYSTLLGFASIALSFSFAFGLAVFKFLDVSGCRRVFADSFRTMHRSCIGASSALYTLYDIALVGILGRIASGCKETV
jgi:hypothetical protein